MYRLVTITGPGTIEDSGTARTFKEAMRWPGPQHPERGVVHRGRFLPIANKAWRERHGL